MKVLITGASRGIGKAVAQEFFLGGHEVFTPTREELDLADNKSVENYVRAHLNDFDVIINNAGINEINDLENVSDSELDMMLRVNMVSPIKLLRGLLGKMKENKFGRIVNIGSIWAIVSKRGRAIYSATKNAMHGITNTLAVELAEHNILVNTVCPGFTATELTYKNNTQQQINDIVKNIPLGRMAEPKEIAGLIYFLGSEKNTYITGQKIAIDGGFSVQ